MKSKRLITLILAGSIIVCSFAGCTAQSKPTDGKAESSSATEVTTAAKTTAAPTHAVTEDATTEAATEVVTDKNGKAVTEVVTNKKGEKVTNKNKKAVTKVVTKKKKTTATKKKTSKKTTKKASNNPTAPSTTQAPQPIGIVLKKNRQAACSSPNVSIATGEVYIEKGGDYAITTETDDWHGQIIIKLANTESCEIRFEGSGKISNDSKNIIQIIDSSINTDRTFLETEQIAGTAADDAIKAVSENEKAPNVDLSFPTGSSWTFESNSNSYTGIVYNESKLTFKGNGKANISAKNNNNCICSTKSISMKNLALTLTTKNNDVPEAFAKGTGSAKGIFSYSKVNVESGTLSIKSNGDSIRCDEFNVSGGRVSLSSSACDGVDADDKILISGGTITSIGLQKHSFKVRRVNNTENGLQKGNVRAGKGDGFYISGGTVIGESKNISSLDRQFQSDKKDSSQANITCKIIKENKGNTEESKTPSIIRIGTLNKTSANKCVKYLYSSSSVKKGTEYKVTISGDKTGNVGWSGNFGSVSIKSSTNK